MRCSASEASASWRSAGVVVLGPAVRPGEAHQLLGAHPAHLRQLPLEGRTERDPRSGRDRDVPGAGCALRRLRPQVLATAPSRSATLVSWARMPLFHRLVNTSASGPTHRSAHRRGDRRLRRRQLPRRAIERHGQPIDLDVIGPELRHARWRNGPSAPDMGTSPRRLGRDDWSPRLRLGRDDWSPRLRLGSSGRGDHAGERPARTNRPRSTSRHR